MAEPVLSVSWKNHTSELATEYKSLLENNFLVDCTLSAEGQRLKAHRLILSACSPYFQMLFQEDSGKHPFVILLNATFETLKAVIDFVYRGETHIPEGNLNSFLTLAQSLQIKGLNAFTQDDQHPHLSDSYSDTVQTNSSIPVEAYNTSCENVQSATSVTHLAEHHRSLGCDEVFADSEVTVKHEPLCHIFPETGNKTPVNVKSYECGAGNFQREMDVGTTKVCGEEDSHIFSSCCESSHGNMESTLMPPAQEQRSQLSDEVPFGRDGEETFQPASLVLKKEHLDDESDMMDDRDIPVNYANEAHEGMESAYDEQNLDRCSRADGVLPAQRQSEMRSWSSGTRESKTLVSQAELLPHEPSAVEPVTGDAGRKASTSRPRVAGSSHARARERAFGVVRGTAGLPPEKELATQRSPPGQQSESPPPHSELQSHEGEQTLLSDEGGTASPHPPSASTHKPRRKGKGRFRCEVCEKAFQYPSKLAVHMRSHTGERPFRCDVCGEAFFQKIALTAHLRIHAGERPFRCDVCGKAFTQSPTLVTHLRIHTGERPFRCEVCNNTFTRKHNLSIHMRIHTGELPFRCDVCGKTFARSNSLLQHCRTHTGARPYNCDVCGKTFRQQGNLCRHMRSHTGGE
ncbi:Krueppel homolog 1 [Gryllus bimaculatus]|nr:Krueppel homolog 1 [Gryllus bimaculatus]